MTRGRGVDPFVLYPLLCPIVLIAAGNDGFGFDPPGWLDSYMYLGYFWHYPEHLWLFDNNSNYKISRLTWVLPGFAAHSLLPTVTAALVLAYATLASAAVATYLHVRDALHDRYAAAFVSLLLACCVGMHAPGGWYYHALPAAGFYLWSCWFVTRAASSAQHHTRWAMAAGASYAAAVHSQLFLAVFVPLLVLLASAAVPERGRPWLRRIAAIVASAIGGGIALTAVLALINRVTGGEWLFFVPQLEIALKVSSADTWWLPAGRWLPTATYLVLPLALTLVGLSSGYLPWKSADRLKETLVVLPVIAFGLAGVFQFWARVTTLDHDYHGFMVYLHAFPAVAVALSSRADGTGRYSGVLLGLTSAVLVGSLLVLMPSYIPSVMTALVTRLGWSELPPVVPPLLLAVAAVALTRVLPASVRIVALTLWFTIVNAWVAPQPSAYGIRTPGARQAMLETFREADTFTHRLDPTLIGIKYWMSSEELQTPHGSLNSQHVFDSFVATRAWLTNLFARRSPGASIPTLTTQHLAAAPCIGILSSPQRQAALVTEMTTHYASLGEPLAVVASRQFDRDGFAFALTVLRPVSRAETTEGRPCASDSEGR